MITHGQRLDIVSVFDAIRILQHDMDFEPRKPCEPTAAMKGTIERLEVYRMRVINGEDLHHPNDEPLATLDQWAECVAFCKASIAATKKAKQEAAKVQTAIRSERQIRRNASAKRCRQAERERDKEQRVAERRPAAFAKHPDVIDS